MLTGEKLKFLRKRKTKWKDKKGYIVQTLNKRNKKKVSIAILVSDNKNTHKRSITRNRHIFVTIKQLAQF